MTTYEQSTGRWFLSNGTLLGTGYAGHGEGKNNPDKEAVKMVGPLPRGTYSATRLILDDPHTGWYTIVLEPDAPTREKILSYGRDPDSFRIHGDEVDHPGEASDGCIVQMRTTRLEFWEGGDRIVNVVAGPLPPQQTSYPRYL